jgi:hypothetical protein
MVPSSSEEKHEHERAIAMTMAVAEKVPAPVPVMKGRRAMVSVVSLCHGRVESGQASTSHLLCQFTPNCCK